MYIYFIFHKYAMDLYQKRYQVTYGYLLSWNIYKFNSQRKWLTWITKAPQLNWRFLSQLFHSFSFNADNLQFECENDKHVQQMNVYTRWLLVSNEIEIFFSSYFNWDQNKLNNKVISMPNIFFFFRHKRSEC